MSEIAYDTDHSSDHVATVGLDEEQHKLVVLSNIEDSFYREFFKDWSELNTFISHLQLIGEVAWGKEPVDYSEPQYDI